MSPEHFVYWLQGFMELADPKELDAKELQIIKDHLKEVFNKVTPQRYQLPPDLWIGDRNHIHYTYGYRESTGAGTSYEQSTGETYAASTQAPDQNTQRQSDTDLLNVTIGC